MQQLPMLSLVRVHKGYDFGDMVFVFLLRADFFDAFFGFKLLTIILRFWVFFGLFFLLHNLFLCSRQAIGEKTEQVDQSTWVLEKCIGWQFTLGDLTGSPAYYLFELSWVFERNGEELADEQEMEQLFLDFGVHKDLVGHVGDECGQVDTLSEPALTHYSVYLCQRYHVFALEAFPGAHAGLVILPQPQLIEMFDERDKNILGVVLLKGQVGVGGIKGGDARWVKVLIRNGGFRRDGF